jgi:hypothetical protein
MSKSSKDFSQEERDSALAKLNQLAGIIGNKQLLLSMERLLHRSLKHLAMYQGQQELCDDIRSVLEWADAVIKEEMERGEGATNCPDILGLTH